MCRKYRYCRTSVGVDDVLLYSIPHTSVHYVATTSRPAPHLWQVSRMCSIDIELRLGSKSSACNDNIDILAHLLESMMFCCTTFPIHVSIMLQLYPGHLYTHGKRCDSTQSISSCGAGASRRHVMAISIFSHICWNR